MSMLVERNQQPKSVLCTLHGDLRRVIEATSPQVTESYGFI